MLWKHLNCLFNPVKVPLGLGSIPSNVTDRCFSACGLYSAGSPLNIRWWPEKQSQCFFLSNQSSKGNKEIKVIIFSKLFWKSEESERLKLSLIVAVFKCYRFIMQIAFPKPKRHMNWENCRDTVKRECTRNSETLRSFFLSCQPEIDIYKKLDLTSQSHKILLYLKTPHLRIKVWRKKTKLIILMNQCWFSLFLTL